MKLSIVIPAYNIATWIGRTLDSIVDQAKCGYDFEIVVVNDGSTDETLNVIKSWRQTITARDALWEDRLRVVTQINAGVNKARERGFAESTGEYVWFVDGDDLLSQNALDSIAPYLDWATSILWVDQVCGSKIVFPVLPTKPEIEVYNNDLRKVPFFVMHQCIFRRDVAQSVPFEQYLVGEDILFTQRAMLLADTIVHVKAPLYGYITRESSVMNVRRNARRTSQTIAFTAALLKLYETEHGRFNPKMVSQRRTQMYFTLPSEILRYRGDEYDVLRSEWGLATGCSTCYISLLIRAMAIRFYSSIRRCLECMSR